MTKRKKDKHSGCCPHIPMDEPKIEKMLENKSMFPQEITDVFDYKWKEIAKEENEYYHDRCNILTIVTPDKFDVICECPECTNFFPMTSERIRSIFLPHFCPDLVKFERI